MTAKVFVAALALSMCATLQAAPVVDEGVDGVATQSQPIAPAAAMLPAEIALHLETSRAWETLVANETKSELQGAVADGRDGWSDSCCCAIPTSKLCPCTYGWADMLILWRDNDAANRPLVINLNTNNTLISTGDLYFDTVWGVRAGFVIRVACV
jgi:hypothetical protein